MSTALIPQLPRVGVPGQALFEDPALSHDVVASTLNGELGPDGRLASVSAVLRRGVPGHRSLFELDLTISRQPGARLERRRVLAKLYAKDQGRGAHEVLCDLWGRGFSAGPCRVPKPLGYHPAWRLLLLEWVEGSLLRDAILEDLPTTAVMERAALWLAQLHHCGAATGRVYTFERHLHTLGRWADRIAGLLPPARPLLADLLSWIEERGKAVSGWAPGPTHRDFSPDHLLSRGPVLTGLDFDEFCQYDPLFDVAHFLAHLRCLAPQCPAVGSHLDKLANAFCAAYRALAPEYSEPRLALHSAISYFKLAHIAAAVTRPPDWEDRVVFLLNTARRAGEGILCD